MSHSWVLSTCIDFWKCFIHSQMVARALHTCSSIAEVWFVHLCGSNLCFCFEASAFCLITLPYNYTFATAYKLGDAIFALRKFQEQLLVQMWSCQWMSYLILLAVNWILVIMFYTGMSDSVQTLALVSHIHLSVSVWFMLQDASSTFAIYHSA